MKKTAARREAIQRCVGSLAMLGILLALQAPAVVAAQGDDAPRVTDNQGGPVLWQVEVFKKVGDTPLRAHIFSTPHQGSNAARPALVWFHGESWMSYLAGSPLTFAQPARYFAARGMVVVLPEYRLSAYRDKRGSALPAVADAKSAIRWVRANAKRLGVDPNRIVAAGETSGAHLAACAGVIGGLEEPGEDATVSGAPNLLLLINGWLDTVMSRGAMGAMKSLAPKPESISPAHNVAAGAPPTVILHGVGRSGTPKAEAGNFADAMARAGNDCQVTWIKGISSANIAPVSHNVHVGSTPRLLGQTLQYIDRYLAGRGLISGPPATITELQVSQDRGMDKARYPGIPENLPVDALTDKPTPPYVAKTVLGGVEWDMQVYRKCGQTDLRTHIFRPAESAAGRPAGAMVIFHGGTWHSGTPMGSLMQARYFASRGMVVFVPEYRLVSKKWEIPTDAKASVFDSIADAVSAIRWVRANAKRFGIDPKRVAAMGEDVGGHLALCAAMLDAPAAAGQDVNVRGTPDVVVCLASPVDLPAWYLHRRYDVLRELGERITDISPAHNIKAGAPPVLILHGTADRCVKVDDARRFVTAMAKAGNSCDLVILEDVPHAWTRPVMIGNNRNSRPDLLGQWLALMDKALAGRGYLQGPPAVRQFKVSQDVWNASIRRRTDLPDRLIEMPEEAKGE